MEEITIKDFLDEYFDTNYLHQNLKKIYQTIVYLSSQYNKQLDNECILKLQQLKEIIEKQYSNTKNSNCLKLMGQLEIVLLKQSGQNEIIEIIFDKSINLNEKQLLEILSFLGEKDYFQTIITILKKAKSSVVLSADIINYLEPFCENNRNYEFIEIKKTLLKHLVNYFNILNSKIKKMSFEKLNIEFQKLKTFGLISAYLTNKSLEEILIIMKNWPNVIDNMNIIYEQKYQLKEQLNQVYEKIIHNYDQQTVKKLVNGEIVLREHLNKNYSLANNLNFDDNLPIIENRYILSIDSTESPDIDSAFSIEKVDDIYILDIYVADVPSLLAKNFKVCRSAYQMGTSLYLHDRNKNINFDMIPTFISSKWISLHSEGYPKNVINFNFVVGKDGTIYSESVGRCRILVNDNLIESQANDILKNKEKLGRREESIYYLHQLCKILSTNEDYPLFDSLKLGRAQHLISFISILINYYVARVNEFAIYRKSGVYTTTKMDIPYVHASAPIRRFADDINLAILLRQNNLQTFPAKEFNYLENNLEEIVAHLNEQDKLSIFFNKNNSLVKKYFL